VCAAEQADVLGTAIAAESERFVVMKLQASARTAPPADVIDERTPSTIPLDDEASDGGRNIAGTG
jgi:hypothetical protein